jgi:hypothetical protein
VQEEVAVVDVAAITIRTLPKKRTIQLGEDNPKEVGDNDETTATLGIPFCIHKISK